MITSPLQISNCVVWLDASDTTTLFQLSGGTTGVSNNNPVGYWGDKSGNARHFTNVGGSDSTRPIWIAALSTVRFDGSNDYLSSFFNINYTAQTVFVVVSQRVQVTNARIYTQVSSGGADSTATGHFLPCFVVGTNQLASFQGSSNRSTVSTRNLNTFDIFTSWFSSLSTANFINGSAGAYAGTSLNYTVALSRLGATATTVNNYFNGDISEVIVYNKALTNAEREDVEYYLTRKWSILNVFPRQVYAIQSGNWSDSAIWSTGLDPAPWTFPLSSDNVYSNTFTVTADQSVRVSTLQTNSLVPNITAGGTIIFDRPNITAVAINGFLAGTAPCITGILSSGSSVLNGNIVGSGALHIGSGQIRIIGNVTGGTVASSIGVTNNSTGNINIIGNVTGGTQASTFGANNNSTGNLFISGNVVGGSNATAYGANNNSTGNLFISGNVVGGSNATAYGAHNNGNGNITVVGNVSGSNTSVGLFNNANASLGGNNAAGNLYVLGNVRAGAGTNNSGGISNNGNGTVYVTGNVLAGTVASNNSSIGNTNFGAVIVVGNVSGSTGTSTQAINNASTGTLLISGIITASAGAHGVISPNIGARNEFTGSLINDLNGRQAVYCARYFVKPRIFDSYTRMAGPTATNAPVFYYGADSYGTSYVPHTSSVVFGTTYAAVSSLSGINVNIPVQLSGTMVVPSVNAVELGRSVGPVGTGTAVLNIESLRKIWDVNVNTLTAADSIGLRLGNATTIEEVGQQIQNSNL